MFKMTDIFRYIFFADHKLVNLNTLKMDDCLEPMLKCKNYTTNKLNQLSVSIFRFFFTSFSSITSFITETREFLP